MRRNDREITDRTILAAVLAENKVCRLALSSDREPYIVPMSYGWEGESLFLHSAPQGRKLDIMAVNPNVCVEITDSVVPISAAAACGHSTAYRSVICRGKATVVSALEDKRAALQVIMRQQTGRSGWELREEDLEMVTVIRVAITDMTGKQKPLPEPGARSAGNSEPDEPLSGLKRKLCRLPKEGSGACARYSQALQYEAAHARWICSSCLRVASRKSLLCSPVRLPQAASGESLPAKGALPQQAEGEMPRSHPGEPDSIFQSNQNRIPDGRLEEHSRGEGSGSDKGVGRDKSKEKGKSERGSRKGAGKRSRKGKKKKHPKETGYPGRRQHHGGEG